VVHPRSEGKGGDEMGEVYSFGQMRDGGDFFLALAARVMETFLAWLQEQPNGLSLYADVQLVDVALDEGCVGDGRRYACEAACRLARVVACSPFVDELGPLFETVHEGWMREGGSCGVCERDGRLGRVVGSGSGVSW